LLRKKKSNDYQIAVAAKMALKSSILEAILVVTKKNIKTLTETE